MTIPSGEVERSDTRLSETDTHCERETPRDGWYHPPFTDTHAEGHGIYGHADRHAMAGYVVHRYMYVYIILFNRWGTIDILKAKNLWIVYATIWMCGSQYMVVVEERGQGRGRLTVVLASRLDPLSRSTFTTSTWPNKAEWWRAVSSSYQRQTHTVRERHLGMILTHHSQTHAEGQYAHAYTQLHSHLLDRHK